MKKLNTLFTDDQVENIEKLSGIASKSEVARAAMSIGLMELELLEGSAGHIEMAVHAKKLSSAS